MKQSMLKIDKQIQKKKGKNCCDPDVYLNNIEKASVVDNGDSRHRYGCNREQQTDCQAIDKHQNQIIYTPGPGYFAALASWRLVFPDQHQYQNPNKDR